MTMRLLRADGVVVGRIVCRCGSEDVVSIEPGSAPVIAPGAFTAHRGSPAIGWCATCAPWLRGYQSTRGVGE